MVGDALGQRALARGGRTVDGDDHWPHVPGFGEARAQALHEGAELGEAGGDHGRVVDRHGAVGAQAQREEGHGDAMVEVGGNHAAAAHALAAADHERVAVDLGCHAVRQQARRRRSQPVALLHLQLGQARPCAFRRRRRRQGRRARDIRRSCSARAPPARRTPFSLECRTRMSATGSPPSLRSLRKATSAPISRSVV